jgi:hypothetical protein
METTVAGKPQCRESHGPDYDGVGASRRPENHNGLAVAADASRLDRILALPGRTPDWKAA